MTIFSTHDRISYFNDTFPAKSLWPRLSHPNNFVSLKVRAFGKQEGHALLINPSPVKISILFAFY